MKFAFIIFISVFSVLRAGQPTEANSYEVLSTTTEQIDSLAKLPVVVRDALTVRVGSVADRGELFSAGCVGRGAHRRFIQAGRSSDYWWVHYEAGGIAHHSAVVVFELKDQKAIFNTEAYSGLFVPDFALLLESLKPKSEQKK